MESPMILHKVITYRCYNLIQNLEIPCNGGFLNVEEDFFID